MKKRFLLLAAAVLALFSGCQTSYGEKSPTGFWKDSELELYLSQFGVPLEQAMEDLGISKEDLTAGDHGEWILPQTREINGMEFSQMLSVFPENADYNDEGFDWNGFDHNNTIYRVDLIYSGRVDENNSADQLRERGISFAVQAKEVYGAPSTYPGIQERIFDEEGNLKGDEYDSYKEDWQVSEDVTANLSMHCTDQGMMLQFTYMPDIVREYALFKRTEGIK